MDDTIETELETGHVITQCRKHEKEYCHVCCLDFRDLNEEARRESAAEVSAKAARTKRHDARRGPCQAAGCDKTGELLCAQCKRIGYCSPECQKADWKTHRKDCKGSLPTFVNSLSQKEIKTFSVGTVMEMVGGTSPLRIKIRKFNPPGSGRPADSTADGLATYTVVNVDDKKGEVWEEPCEDVHSEGCWKLCR